MAVACGECFSWAFAHAPEADWLVHATVHDPWDGHPYPHAWIEAGKRVYDWQSVVVGLGPGRRGWPRRRFYATYRPINVRRYDADHARVMVLRHGHSGPWDGQP